MKKKLILTVILSLAIISVASSEIRRFHAFNGIGGIKILDKAVFLEYDTDDNSYVEKKCAKGLHFDCWNTIKFTFREERP